PLVACGVPRRVASDPRPGGVLEGDGHDHAGRRRPVGRHRLRAGPPLPHHRAAARRRTPAPSRGTARGGGSRSEEKSATKLGLPTPGDVLAPLALQKRTVKLTGGRLAMLVCALIAVLALVRIVTGANELDSAGTIAAAIGFAIPIGMAGLGGLWSERSGV